jgi:hypothetical protein
MSDLQQQLHELAQAHGPSALAAAFARGVGGRRGNARKTAWLAQTHGSDANLGPVAQGRRPWRIGWLVSRRPCGPRAAGTGVAVRHKTCADYGWRC